MRSRPSIMRIPSLNQTNASLKGNAWFDIAHDLAVLANFQIAHLNEGVGSVDFAGQCDHADAVQSDCPATSRCASSSTG